VHAKGGSICSSKIRTDQSDATSLLQSSAGVKENHRPSAVSSLFYPAQAEQEHAPDPIEKSATMSARSRGGEKAW
jgi:hypothetical protein